MGYTTDFNTNVIIQPALNKEQVKYIQNFSYARKIARNIEDLKQKYEGVYGLFGEYGIEGEYFIGDDEITGIKNYNQPPSTQPGLYCQWTVTDDGKKFIWDGGEKFYNYIQWLEYLIVNFFEPWGCKLNGIIEWRGEDFGDNGVIYITDNNIEYRNLI